MHQNFPSTPEQNFPMEVPLRNATKHATEWLGVELNVVSMREKLIGGFGGCVAIFLLLFVTRTIPGLSHSVGFIASMGASAVLLFGVPHGQLSQPWPVIAGHTLSACIGVLCAKWIGGPVLASACAVGISITVMHQLKCIHPPGGATALTAVMGGETIHQMGFEFVIWPVMINALMIVSVAVIFNLAFKWRRYPAAFARKNSPPSSPPGSISLTHEQIVEAVRTLDSFVDITEDDLVKLVQLLAPGNRRHPLLEINPRS